MDKKKKVGIIIIGICILCLIVHFVFPQKNKYLIYEGSGQKVNKDKKNENDILYIGVSQTTDSIHPYKQDNETMDILLDLVYEPLIYVKEDASIKYVNAEKITFEKEGKEAHIKISSNKVFSDKTALTADLIIESYQWFMGQDTAYSEILRNVEEIKKIDNENLIMRFKEVNLDNIKALTMPIVYQQDKKSYYGSTFLGTGAYQISQLKSQQGIILERNKESQRKEEYEKIVLKSIDYRNIDTVIMKQEIDMFSINKGEHFEKIKESGAYDVYELEEKQKGYYLVYNIKEESIRNAIAHTVEGKRFFEDTQEKGIYSSGIVSAYKEGANYYSLIKSGSLKGLKTIKIRHDIDGVSLGIYQNLSETLNKEGIECQEVRVAMEGYKGFKEDILIYQGNYKEAITEENIKEFFKDNSQMDIEEYYKYLEEYLSRKNIMTPLSKETKWIASLTTKDTLDFFE